MRKLSALIDTNRDILRPLRLQFKETNKRMAEYEQDIADKEIKAKARRARLVLKEALKQYNLSMDKIR